MSATVPPVHRVFQVATGNVGAQMLKLIHEHPELELVGLHCYSADKVGTDAGEIVGIGPIGVIATGEVEAIIAAAPDIVTFHGIEPDVDLYTRVLAAGINVITTADWITGNLQYKRAGYDVKGAVEAACEAGGSTMYGTGMNPGLLQILAIVFTADTARVEHVSCTETVDVSFYEAPDTWRLVSWMATTFSAAPTMRDTDASFF